MVNSNSNTKNPAASATGLGSSGSAGAVSSPGGNTGSGGSAAGPSAPGVIPGASSQARAGLRTEITRIANGIGTQLPAASSVLHVKGQPLTRSDLLIALGALLGIYADLDSSRQSLKSKQLALKAALPETREYIADLKVAIVAFYGRGNPVLECFGINPRKSRKLTGEQIVARKVRSGATRGLRGTLGSREKARVKFQGAVQVQTSLSGTQAAGGNPSVAGAATSPTGDAVPSTAGAHAAGSGSGSSQP
jgi:hypothetical protein